MKHLKMSLENIKGKMSRHEMKNIMAGSNWDCTRNGGSFSTDSAELAAAWAAAWNSMGGNAECRHYYISQPPGWA
jgi:hypothetical protein